MSKLSTSRWATTWGVLLLATGYYVSGKLGLLLAIPPGYATAIWPASGIALAALLLGGQRLWPGVLLGSFCVNLATSIDVASGWATARSAAMALTIGGGAALQAILGAFLIRRCVRWPPELVRPTDIGKFFVLGGPVSCLTSSCIGIVTLMLSGSIGVAQVPYSWWTWWVGDSIGVVVVAPILFVWWGYPRDVWRRRRYSVAGPLVCVLSLTVAVFVWISRLEEARIQLEFERYVAVATGEVESSFRNAIQTVRSLGDLHAATADAEQSETFSTFANRTLAVNPWVQALSWNPRVPRDERPAFERRARALGAEDFQIRERTEDGHLTTARVRDDYVVVLHIEPVAPNAAAIGFDVGSDPVRRRALLHACETGEPAATEPIRLVQDTGEDYGILVFSPVYEAADLPQQPAERCRVTRGFATGVIRLGAVMDTALGHHLDPNIQIQMTDMDGSRPTHTVWSSTGERKRSSRVQTTTDGALTRVASVAVAGRQYSLHFTGTPAYLAHTGTWRPWIALAGGMLFVGILAAFLLVVTGHAIVIERLGTEREAELLRANRDLQREIAGRKDAEHALQRNEERLRQSQKMEAVGQLAGGVAHDFNNLLTVIDGYGELLAERLAGDPEATADLDEIRRAAKSATSLTRQLLAFSRKQILIPQNLDLNALVLGLHPMLQRLLEENITVRFHPSSQAVTVRADPGQLEQIIVNLAVNARDAMPQGGTLTIETSSVSLDRTQSDTHPEIEPGQYVVLSVSDTGTGMTPDVQRRVFEPFFTTKPRDRGTGLGLATVQGIVKQSGGEIEVSSRVGVGTTFTIHLPATSSSALTADAPQESQDTVTRAETVLVVEDEDNLRALVARILGQHGYTVLSAGSVEDGVRVSAEHPGAIDLLLTDVVMPGGSGRDVARQVMAARPGLRVIYMSGYTDDAIVQHGVLETGITFLQKPFTPRALAKKVREVLDGGAHGSARVMRPFPRVSR